MQQGPFWGHLSLVPLVASGVLAILLLLSAMMLRKRTLRLRLPARFESIRWLSSVVDELAREARMSEEAIFQCRLAISEALANIINHSYRRDPSGEIEAFIRLTAPVSHPDRLRRTVRPDQCECTGDDSLHRRGEAGWARAAPDAERHG